MRVSYVRCKTDVGSGRGNAGYMQAIQIPQVEAADLLKQGIVLTFSDGLTVLLPTPLLLQIRDLPEATHLLPVEDDY